MSQVEGNGNEAGGVRGFIDRHRGIVAGVMVAIIATVLFVQFRPAPAGKMFLTTDDGKTHFSHDYAVPPVMVDGKEAVQAVVFTCGAGTQPFVGYMIRYTPEGKAKATANATTGPRPTGAGWPEGVEVKKPGEGDWVSTSGGPGGAPAAGAAMRKGLLTVDKITTITCSGGGFALPLSP